MKLDVSILRYLEDEHFRVLTAIEMGMRNHEVVPTPLIERIAGLKMGGTKRRLGELLKWKLIHHENRQYDGFCLVAAGYDFLALRTFAKRNKVAAVGNQIGVGKESDVFVVSDDDGRELVLKVHRLGRTSFQSVTSKRDYFRSKKRRGAGWLYLSRLSAMKEYAFMSALHSEGFPVPEPIDQNRHCVLMSFVPGHLMTHILEMGHPDRVYQRSLNLLTRLAQYGLIHGDYNEFNLIVDQTEEVWLIDFPQMTSTEHFNGQMYFDRDLDCIHKFFKRKYNLHIDYYPKLKESPELARQRELDTALKASGWSRAKEAELQQFLESRAAQARNDSDEEEEEEEEEEEGEEGSEEENEEEGEDDVDKEVEEGPACGDEDGMKSIKKVGRKEGAEEDEEDAEVEPRMQSIKVSGRTGKDDDGCGSGGELEDGEVGVVPSVDDSAWWAPPVLPGDDDGEVWWKPDGEEGEAPPSSLGGKKGGAGYMKGKVRAKLEAEGAREFNRRLNRRNMLKGREKKKTRNQIKYRMSTDC